MRVLWRGKVYGVKAAGGRVAVTLEGGGTRTMEVPLTRAEVVRDRTGLWVWADGVSACLRPAGTAGRAGSADEVRSPMTGTVVGISVKPGDAVQAGAPLAVVAAMKMEFRIEAPRDGVVKEVACKPGDRVDLGALLLRLKPLQT